MPLKIDPPPSTEELKRSTSQPAVEAPKEDPRDQREYTFKFDYVDKRGKSWTGSFRNRILSIGDRQAVANLQARIQDSIPEEAISESQREINAAIAHMSYSLVDAPEWAKDLRELLDVRLVVKLWEEVASHEATFWRLGEDQEAGEGQG